MSKSICIKVLTLGSIYSFCISLIMYLVGNIMFSEFISFFFFFLISLVPSVSVFGILLSINSRSRMGNFLTLLTSIILGFFVSFLSLFISLFVDTTFNEKIYWSLADFEGFKWFVYFSLIGSFLCLPLSFVLIKIARKL